MISIVDNIYIIVAYFLVFVKIYYVNCVFFVKTSLKPIKNGQTVFGDLAFFGGVIYNEEKTWRYLK